MVGGRDVDRIACVHRRTLSHVGVDGENDDVGGGRSGQGERRSAGADTDAHHAAADLRGAVGDHLHCSAHRHVAVVEVGLRRGSDLVVANRRTNARGLTDTDGTRHRDDGRIVLRIDSQADGPRHVWRLGEKRLLKEGLRLAMDDVDGDHPREPKARFFLALPVGARHSADPRVRIGAGGVDRGRDLQHTCGDLDRRGLDIGFGDRRGCCRADQIHPDRHSKSPRAAKRHGSRQRPDQ